MTYLQVGQYHYRCWIRSVESPVTADQYSDEERHTLNLFLLMFLVGKENTGIEWIMINRRGETKPLVIGLRI